MAEPVSSNLKPCPFCGAPVEFEEIKGHSHDGIDWSIGCETEGCFGFQSLIKFPTRRAAIEAWNKRPADETTSAHPQIHGIRYDITGWICSICHTWCDEDKDFCTHPRPVQETTPKHPCACPAGGCGRLTLYPNQYCREQNGDC